MYGNYKVNQSILVRYLAIDLRENISDLYLIATNPYNIDSVPIPTSHVEKGLYQASFIPNLIGWWNVRVKSDNFPVNIYSQRFFIVNNYADVTLEERLKVDSSQAKYRSYFNTIITDQNLVQNTDFWIINLQNKSGILQEVHIVTSDTGCYFKIEIDGIMVFDVQGINLKNKFALDTTTGIKVKQIETSTGVDLHLILPMNFNTSLRIGVNTPNNNKKLYGSLINWRELI